MVERYLAIKLEKCAKCPAGQIVKYKLNNKKKVPPQINPSYHPPDSISDVVAIIS